MKKILPYIFILTVIVQLFVPFSVRVSETKNRIFLNNKTAFAEDENTYNVRINSTATIGYNYINVNVKILEKGEGNLSAGSVVGYGTFLLKISLLDENKDKIGWSGKVESFQLTDPKYNDTKDVKFEGLTPSTKYIIKSELFSQIQTSYTQGTGGGYTQTVDTPIFEDYVEVETTSKEYESITQELGEASGSNTYGNTSSVDDVFNCDLYHMQGCFAEIAYTILFKPSAFLFGLTGRAMDITLKYSLEDTSYRSVFVVEGWGIVRDICNIFFIFVLLFIAFQVILGLGGKGDPKGLIVNVIIVGLLINFSLFATRIIIDASNILSRVFYNAETINIKSEGKDLGSLGEIKFSEALVQKINPISLLTDSSKVGDLSGAMQTAEEDQQIGSRDVKKVSTAIPVGLGTFVIICMLCAALCIVGVVVFLNLALVFIARVVMLWLAMIISPLAFFSYTVPRLQKMPFIGFGNWIEETTKMAFMAPVFCFFIYIIISFLEEGLGLIDVGQNATGFDFVLGIAVPFIFLSILLLKTKEIAMSMSGQAGKMIAGAGEKMAGAALGLASGGAAMAMRGTFGKLGAKMASSGSLAKMEEKGGIQGFLGRNLRNAGLSLGTKSYDIRNTGTGKRIAKELGVEKTVNDTLSSRSKTGVGIIGNREERLKKVEKRETDLNKFRPKTEEEKQVEDLVEQQVKLQNKNATSMAKAEKEKEDAKEKEDGKRANYNMAKENLRNKEKAYARVKGTGTAKEKEVQDELQKAQDENDRTLNELNEAKKEHDEAKKRLSAINNGGSISVKNEKGEISHTLPNAYNTTNGNITEKLYKTAKEDYEKAEKEEGEKKKIFESLDKGKTPNINDVQKEESKQITNVIIEISKLEQKEKDKRANTIKRAEDFYDGEINKTGAQLKSATGTQQRIDLTKKIEDLKKEKNTEVAKITMEANNSYREAQKQIREDKDNKINQIKKKAIEDIKTIEKEVEKAQREYSEARAKEIESKYTLEAAEKAKEYAEQHGGFGKSKSQLKKEIAELNVEIDKGSEQRMINTAERLEAKNIFDLSETSELTKGQRQEKRVKIYNSLNKTGDKK